MKKEFTVRLYYSTYVDVRVEADSEEEAINAAREEVVFADLEDNVIEDGNPDIMEIKSI